MRKIQKIPTILGLLILTIGLFGGVALIRQKSVWFLRASSEITPKQVRITNISENGFTVSWITDNQTSGFVKYGTDNNLNLTAADDRDKLSGKTGKFFVHHVALKNLKANTNYYFKIGSGENLFTNNGELYQQITARPPQGSPPTNDVAYGTVLEQDKGPAEGVIIYLSLANTTPQSALTKSSGSWVIPLNLSYTNDLSGYAPYDRQASIEEIFVQGGSLGTATATTLTKNDSPVPAITLGQTYDFQTQPTSPSEETPTPTPQAESKFAVPGELKIITPTEGEKISNQTPEIFGSGPAGETLSITLQSFTPYSGSVKIDSSGKWKWSPPASVEPGEHIISVLLSNGKRVSRSFTVLAAGATDLPSFTSTPSATLTPTSTPPPRTSLPSTESGVPSPGYLTPTFFIFIMGAGLIFLGIFTYAR